MYRALDLVDVDDIAVLVESNLFLRSRCLDRVLGGENLVEFLEL
jgi:hypothetical protein